MHRPQAQTPALLRTYLIAKRGGPSTGFELVLDFNPINEYSPSVKTLKLRDGGGQFLHVEPTGARGWRFCYRRPVTKK
jgi:hypothetical protein